MKINDKQSQQIATIFTAIATIVLSGALSWYFMSKAITVSMLCEMIMVAIIVYSVAVLVLGVENANRN